MAANNKIVFLGSSLDLAEAKNLCPDARFLVPAKCGDILQVMRLSPSIIAIVDGFFENTPAIWHKEILYALENKVQVYGSSSMGALRAAELKSFGMQGVGKIYEDYATNELNDDDDVALLHANEELQYIPLSVPMVNVIYTLKKAFSLKLISERQLHWVRAKAKKIYYKERSLQKIVTILEQGGRGFLLFKQWIEENGLIDQKRLDAIELLKTINDEKASRQNISFSMNYTVVFKRLYKEMMCKPFNNAYEWLPKEEKVLMAARYFGKSYRLTRSLAYLLAIMNKFIADEKSHAVSKDSIKYYKAFMTTHSYGNEVFWKYLIILLKLSGEYTLYKKYVNDIDNRFFSMVKAYKKHGDIIIFRAIYYTAKAWAILDNYLSDQYEIRDASIKVYYNEFFERKGITDSETLKEWMLNNDIASNEQFQDLIAAGAKFNYLYFKGYADHHLTIDYSELNNWLLDAAQITKIYTLGEKLLVNNEYQCRILEEFKKNLPSKNRYEYAISLDFIDENEMSVTSL